ncbi:hypothetical protein AVEN_183680-1 [Araneus ventricosus]|uniref:Uncharacterized protein n=1 Tax=Araneus ventricosus TaxID=182803 RepID=A0A4Y2N219_ARAVE|nr:hypothetical protein AVEN_183680-1 [Araneus ventricosus]
MVWSIRSSPSATKLFSQEPTNYTSPVTGCFMILAFIKMDIHGETTPSQINGMVALHAVPIFSPSVYVGHSERLHSSGHSNPLGLLRLLLFSLLKWDLSIPLRFPPPWVYMLLFSLL